MARPRKEGLDYFPLDTNMDLTDDKIQLIEGLYGAVGFATIIKLFMKIYNSGYFYKWGEAEQILMAKRIGIEVNSLKNIVNDCVKYGLFQEKLFIKHNLLTSKGIQKRYFSACGKKKTGEVFNDYLLIDEEMLFDMCPKIIISKLFQEKPLVIPRKTVVIPKSSTQIKQNKIKQNKTKINNTKNGVFNDENNENLKVYDSISNQIKVFTNDEELKNILHQFMLMREKMKSKMTDYAFNLLLKKLTKFSTDTNIQKDILNQSIINSWKSIFELSKNYEKVYSNKKNVKALPTWYANYEKQLNGEITEQSSMSKEEQEQMKQLAKNIF